jgi:hypothetical protein
MPRKDLQKSMFHAHPGNPGDPAHLRKEANETDAHAVPELAESWNGSWEAAWIDLGGEG